MKWAKRRNGSPNQIGKAFPIDKNKKRKYGYKSPKMDTYKIYNEAY